MNDLKIIKGTTPILVAREAGMSSWARAIVDALLIELFIDLFLP